MTNQELQKIINLAKKYKMKVKDLKMLLKLFTNNDGNINEQQLSDIEFIILKGFFDDKELKIILEKLLKQNYTKWHCLGNLLYYPIIKKYLAEKEFPNEVWDVVFYNIRNMPTKNYILEKLYCEKLELYHANSKEELDFFGAFFDIIKNYSFALNSWIWEYFFDKQKSLNERNKILYIIKSLNQKFSFLEISSKIKNVIKCYELYGEKLAASYARALNKLDLEIPTITSEEEKRIFIILYDFLFFSCRENTAVNYLNSIYYQILTNNKIEVEKRLEFAENLIEYQLVLKDSIVISLWHTYLEQGFDAMITLKHAYLNNGIRTNILCKTFLMQETKPEVLELARQVFRNNRVRKDTENLSILNDLQTSDEKIEFLHFLASKYPDISEEQKQQLEEEAKDKEVREKIAQDSYNDFLNNKIGLAKLTESLNDAENISFDLIRVRRK